MAEIFILLKIIIYEKDILYGSGSPGRRRMQLAFKFK